MSDNPWRVALAALLGAALVLLAMALASQEARGQEIRCVKLAQLLDHLRDRHGEHLVFSGRDARGAPMHLTRAESGRWTMIVEVVPGLGCIVGGGQASKLDYGI